MKRRLVRKTFDMIDEIANRENKEVCLPDVVVFLCQSPYMGCEFKEENR